MVLNKCNIAQSQGLNACNKSGAPKSKGFIFFIHCNNGDVAEVLSDKALCNKTRVGSGNVIAPYITGGAQRHQATKARYRLLNIDQHIGGWLQLARQIGNFGGLCHRNYMRVTCLKWFDKWWPEKH